MELASEFYIQDEIPSRPDDDQSATPNPRKILQIKPFYLLKRENYSMLLDRTFTLIILIHREFDKDSHTSIVNKILQINNVRNKPYAFTYNNLQLLAKSDSLTPEYNEAQI